MELKGWVVSEIRTKKPGKSGKDFECIIYISEDEDFVWEVYHGWQVKSGRVATIELAAAKVDATLELL